MTNLDFDSIPDSAHMTVKDVSAMLRVSVATVWRMAAAGTLPQPKKFSTRCTRWMCGDIRKLAGIGTHHEVMRGG